MWVRRPYGLFWGWHLIRNSILLTRDLLSIDVLAGPFAAKIAEIPSCGLEIRLRTSVNDYCRHNKTEPLFRESLKKAITAHTFVVETASFGTLWLWVSSFQILTEQTDRRPIDLAVALADKISAAQPDHLA